MEYQRDKDKRLNWLGYLLNAYGIVIERRAAKMKHRLFYLITPLVLIFFLGASLFISPSAAANGENYTFHYQKGQKDQTEKALSELAGTSSDNVLQYTYVTASGGVFGGQALTLDYQATGPTDVPDGSALNSDGHFFGGAGGNSSYKCDGMTINIILQAQPTPNLDKGLNFQAWITSAEKGGQGVQASAVPAHCRPGGAGLADVSSSHPKTQSANSVGDVTPPSPNNNNNDDCESSGGGFSLNWLLCDAYNGVQGVVNWMLNSVITPLLSSTPICLPDNNTCKDTIYQVWSHFRVYGDIFLVITLLVIVFGESIGGGLIDAYTAKKVLPRLLAAGILLNLSIYIMAFSIDLTNIVGRGLGSLLTSPLQGQGLFQIAPSGITSDAIFVGGAGVALLAGFTVVSVTGIALLALGLAVTGLIAILGVFFTLIIRQAIIVGLVMLSPVAFALWCLPNTSSWFKRWWDTFFQMLLVYPMVILLFAVADVMSYITTQNGKGGNFADSVVSFMLLIIPLYLVPFTLRSSNRLLGSIQGAASNVGRQINAATGRRALSGAGQEAGKKLGDTFAGQRWQGNNVATRAVNNIGGRLGVGIKGRFGVGARGRGALDIQRRAASIEAQKSNAKLQQLAFDDHAIAVLAASGGTVAGARRAAQKMGLSDEETARAIGTAQTVGFNDTNAAAAIDLMAQNKSRALNVDNGLAGQAGVDLIRESAAQISHGNEQMTENMVGGFAFHSRNAGRLDHGGEVAGQSLAAGWNRAGVAQHAQAFGASTQHYMEEFTRIMNDPHTDIDEKRAAAVALSEMHHALPNATGENQTHINNALAAIGIDLTGGAPVDVQLAARVGPAPGGGGPGMTAAEISRRARTYGSEVPTGAIGGAPGAPGTPPAAPPAAGGGAALSDRRLKRNVSGLYTTSDDITLYRFQYLWSDQVYVGVMAQDLIDTHPEALSLDERGFYKVDYSMLGLKMMTIEEWTSRQSCKAPTKNP